MDTQEDTKFAMTKKECGRGCVGWVRAGGGKAEEEVVVVVRQ